VFRNCISERFVGAHTFQLGVRNLPIGMDIHEIKVLNLHVGSGLPSSSNVSLPFVSKWLNFYILILL